MIEYETETFRGVILLAGPETGAPEITYSPGVRGWHAISIGTWKLKGWYLTQGNSPELRIKLSGDDTFSVMALPVLPQPLEDPVAGWDRWTGGEDLGESFWQVADLLADRERSDTRRLYTHNDVEFFRLRTPEEIRRHIEPFRDSDFSRIYWEGAMGDLAFYFSKIGRVGTHDGLDDFFHAEARSSAENWRRFEERSIDPFEVAIEHTHDIGLEFHACYRVSGFHTPLSHDHWDHGGFVYDGHPEWRGMDRYGNPTPHVAYTYPEARRWVVSLLKEMAGYPIDGICLLYNRRPPLVEYEPPLIEGFKAEYGQDPRDLDEKDRRWLSYRARALTQFMREVREAMDEAGEAQGRPRRIEVSAIVMSGEEENLVNGMDVKAWIDEGLIDTLIPYTSLPNLNHQAEAWAEVSKLDYFVSLTQGTSCRLAPNINPADISPEEYRRMAAELYGKGAEHLFFWWGDVGNANYGASWTALRRLGHREEIEAWVRAGKPSLADPVHPIRKLGDWDTSYVTPG